jgi:DNA transposition AAA+ family ATPase
MDGGSPDEVFAGCLGPQRKPAPDAPTLALLMSDYRRAKVDSCAVRLNKRRYTPRPEDRAGWAAMHAVNETEVLVATIPGDAEYAAALDLDGRMIAQLQAEPFIRYAPADAATQARIGQSMEIRRGLEKATRQTLQVIASSARANGARTPEESLYARLELPSGQGPVITHRKPRTGPAPHGAGQEGRGAEERLGDRKQFSGGDVNERQGLGTRDEGVGKARSEAEIERDAAARLRIHDYLDRSGLSQPEFARRIDYSYDTLRLFLTGRYHRIAGSARNVVAAAERYMAAHPIEIATHVLGELYDTENVRLIRETFERLLPRPVAYMIYAPPGSQKSFVAEHEVARLNREQLAQEGGGRAFYIYARQNICPRDIIRRVALASGSRPNASVDAMLSGLRFDWRDQRVILLVDEAQHLSIPCFEVLRELLDRPPYVSLLFMGSHDLKRKFDEFSATLEQWNSRIIAKVRLPGLERMEARAIVLREIGALLGDRTPREVESLVGKLVAGATVTDHFEGDRTYINIRTLVNALDQIKAAHAARARSANEDRAPEIAEEKVEAVA